MVRSSIETILIVEHDDPTRELYSRELSRDYRVVACGDGRDALGLLCAHHIRVVVLEPGSADGGGWDLLATMKHQPDTCTIPIILCSTLDERKRGMELGANAYLVKPVLPKTLLEVVHRVTGRVD